MVGAGAIGGLIAADLVLAGADVTVIDAGAQLRAIGSRGITVRGVDGRERRAASVRATGSFDEPGVQDLVILAVKAYVLDGVARPMRALFGPDTAVLTLQNGLPWWYFQRHGGELEGTSLGSLDPEGRIAASIEPERIIGCVAYPAASVEIPGVIRHLYGRRLPVGELDGTESDRARRVAALFESAGYASSVLSDIRSEIWLKLVGVLAFNCMGALTRSTMADICADERATALAAALMRECEAVAARLGVTLRVPIERRLAGAARVGPHRTSMLQDVEAGRPMEIEAIVGSTRELADRLGVETPRIDVVDALLRILDARSRSGRAVRSGATEPPR